MAEARENYGMTLAAPGGGENPRVRADMALLPVAGGGGVFSTGSIAWAGSLAHDPHISRIFRNILDRFSSSLPLLDESARALELRRGGTNSGRGPGVG
jgi:N,N-dimethylformamidase